MEKTSLATTYVSDNRLYSSQSLSHYSIGLDCWQSGYDISIDRRHRFSCDTTVQRDVVNAASFLYSALIPYGSYLENCTGILRTRESINNRMRSYLYASCDLGLFSTILPSSTGKDFAMVQKIDITDCPAGHIASHEGELSCTSEEGPRRTIVSGSYLNSGCDLVETYYDVNDDRIHTQCDGSPVSISGVTEAIDLSMDVIYQNGHLAFAHTPAGAATVHQASLYLPAGNYTLTCVEAAFFPCMGEAGKGMLLARCMTGDKGVDFPRGFKNTVLEDTNSPCAMNNMGYISNIRGNLVCDPDVEFNDEEPTQGSGLMHHLQCPSSE